jgi:hypothetical protein
MPRFFMSYARMDDDLKQEELISQFFTDLRAEVARGLADAPETVGYLDKQDLETGSDWPTELALAVCSCATFVPILTARYFTRPYCGREWALFEQRCIDAEKRFGKRPPLILPVLWAPPLEGSFPEFAESLVFTPSAKDFSEADREFVHDYRQKGLVAVMKRRAGTHSGIRRLGSAHRRARTKVPARRRRSRETAEPSRRRATLSGHGVRGRRAIELGRRGRRAFCIRGGRRQRRAEYPAER